MQQEWVDVKLGNDFEIEVRISCAPGASEVEMKAMAIKKLQHELLNTNKGAKQDAV